SYELHSRLRDALLVLATEGATDSSKSLDTFLAGPWASRFPTLLLPRLCRVAPEKAVRVALDAYADGDERAIRVGLCFPSLVRNLEASSKHVSKLLTKNHNEELGLTSGSPDLRTLLGIVSNFPERDPATAWTYSTSALAAWVLSSMRRPSSEQ